MNVITSPEEFSNLFEQNNVSFEETLKVPKLVNLANQHGEKSEIITSPFIKENCCSTEKRKPKLRKTKLNLSR